MEKIIIAVDAMGGDHAPETIVEGCALALRDAKEISVRLFGQKNAVLPLLDAFADVKDRIELIDAPEIISMHDEPMLAVRRKKDSSMVMGLMDVREGRAQAFVSAGSTGALFLGGMAYVRMIPGIDRPALAPVLPGLKKPFLLIDSGANADCQPKYLMQFGLMGAAFMKHVMGVSDPQVGLVNIGAEAEKGSKLYKEAYQMMSAQKAYSFAGNCEAREIQKGEFDVTVCDGFTGNVILKYAEGFASVLFTRLKQTVSASARGKIGGLLLKPSFSKLKREMNADEYGGAPLMGVNGTVVKAHGSSNAYAFSRAVLLARSMAEAKVADRISEGIQEVQSAADA